MMIISITPTILRPIIRLFPLVKCHERTHWKQEQTRNFLLTPTIHQSSSEPILKTSKKWKTASFRNSCTHTRTLDELFPDTNPLQKDIQSFIRCRISCSTSLCNWTRGNRFEKCRKFPNEKIECLDSDCNRRYFSNFFPLLKSVARRHSIIHSMQNFMLYKPV